VAPDFWLLYYIGTAKQKGALSEQVAVVVSEAVEEWQSTGKTLRKSD